MSCKKCISTIVLLCHLCLLSTWAASAGLFDLHIGDESYVQTERLTPDLKLSLIMAKLSDIAYQDSLSAADSAFLQDNSIQFEKFFSHHTASFAYHPPYSLTSKTISFDTDGLLANKMITINGVTKKLIIIAFKGTATGGDIITDALASPADFIDNEDIEVHLGFHTYMKAFRNNEPSLDHDAIYLITGHSLGGAIAKLYGASLRERGISKENVLVYTFGAPPVAYKSGGFFDRYNKQSGSLPLHIFETAHKLDPVYHLAYKKVLLSYLKRTEDLTYLGFQEDGKIGTLVMGCDVRGVYGLSGAGDFLFGNSGKRPDCEIYAHSMGLYTYNIYQNLDMTSIIEANIIDTDPDEDVQIAFNQYQLQRIENLAKNYPYAKGVAGPTFESSKLTRQENLALIHELKKLGIFAGFSMFGSLGDDYQLMIKDIVDSKKTVLEIAKNQIDSAQSLELADYGELGFGMAVNSASVAADILTIGSAGSAKFAAKFPGISAKVVSLGDKFADLSRLGKITVKTLPHIKKAVEISKTPQFQIIKALIESNFVINDEVKGIIDQNEAGVGLVKASLGLTGELVKAQFIDESKGKAYAFMLEKIVDIANNIIAGTNEVVFTDKELQTAFHELGDAIIDLVPFYGPFHSQWALGKKISADIDNRPELKEAWANYFSTNQTMLAEVELLGNATRLKRLDVIMTKALSEIKQHYVQLAEEETLAEAREPKMVITLPEGATIENRHIQAQAGETVAFKPFLTAKNLIECMADMADHEVLWKLWYYDGTKGANAPRESLELTLDPETQTYSFFIPSSQIFPVDITYNILNESGLFRTYGGCGMPDKWETAFADTGGVPEGEPGECPVGATEIACQVGVYSQALQIDGMAPTQPRSFVTDGSHAYALQDRKIVSIDLTDKTSVTTDFSDWRFIGQNNATVLKNNHIFTVAQHATDNFVYFLIINLEGNGNLNLISSTKYHEKTNYFPSIEIVNNYTYLSSAYGTSIFDISDFRNPTKLHEYDFGSNSFTVTGEFIYQLYGSGSYYDEEYTKQYIRSININNHETNTIQIYGRNDYQMPFGKMFIIENKLLVSGSSNIEKKCIKIFNLNNPLAPELIVNNEDLFFDSDAKKISHNEIYNRSTQTIINLENFETDKIFINREHTKYNCFANNYMYSQVIQNGLPYVYIYDLTNRKTTTVVASLDYAYSRPIIKGKYILFRDSDTFSIKDFFGNTLATLAESSSYSLEFFSDDVLLFSSRGADGTSILNMYNIRDISNPKRESTIDLAFWPELVVYENNYLYISDYGGYLYVYDLKTINIPVFISRKLFDFRFMAAMVNNNIMYVSSYNSAIGTDRLKIIDLSNKENITVIGGVPDVRVSRDVIFVKGDYLYVKATTSIKSMPNNFFIYDISTPASPVFLKEYILKSESFPNDDIVAVAYSKVFFDDLLILGTDQGLLIINLVAPKDPKVVGVIEESKSIVFQDYLGVSDGNLYSYNRSGNSYMVFDINQSIANIKFINQHFASLSNNIALMTETPLDYSIEKNSFVKTWIFSKNIEEFEIEIISHSYGGSINSGSFIRDGKNLSIPLTPNTFLAINELVLQFTSNGNPIQVSGSDTFWSQTRTNHAPRLADGQTTQLVSAITESARLTINTFDADDDSITLTVEDGAGGYVGFDPEQPNRLFASFSDGQSLHTIKIALDDGKEKVIKELTVMQFDQGSVINFYSDVDPASPDYFFDGIAFGTLKGVIAGQPDPNDGTKRIFRPTDNASLAETLAMIINAEKLAGLIPLETSNNYQEVFPAWAMPYYTFARDANALNEEVLNLANVYPTREEIAKVIVKTLALDEKAKILPALNVAFTDEDQFSDADMLYYGKIAHGFGLFMTGEDAQPLAYITRAELALVIKKIFMMPTATLTLTPASVEYGDSFDISLTDAEAEAINSSINLYDRSDQLTFITIVNQQAVTSPVASTDIFAQAETIYAFIDNQGVRNVIAAPLQIIFSDQDSDGVQDRHDRWPTDSRYSTDANGNDIPDLLDSLYNLSGFDQNSVVSIDGQFLAVSEIISNGGVFPTDPDGDGIAGDVDGNLAYTISILQVLVGKQPTLMITGDVDGDGRIGMAEALYALKQSAQ